jgi:hypothetical protein
MKRLQQAPLLPLTTQREFGIGHLEFPHKAVESFAVRFLLGPAGKGGGQNRKIDRPHGAERQKKSGYKLAAESLIARWPDQL